MVKTLLGLVLVLLLVALLGYVLVAKSDTPSKRLAELLRALARWTAGSRCLAVCSRQRPKVVAHIKRSVHPLSR